MPSIERFEDIEAWKRAREVTKKIYQLSSSGDFTRDFGLKDQIRRSSVSVMSNIAEGFERDGNREFINFLSIAKASCGEARSQLYVALDQDFITAEDFQCTYDHFDQTGRMIGGFMNYLRQSDLKGKKFT
ncbi:MAG: four helix bundle protein [Chloracidobacterium sp.]|nr:four helix bundle protein [Chloracidobacterium sp.]